MIKKRKYQNRQLKQELLNKGLKVCSKCKIEKDINEFHKNKTQKDDLQGHCKNCNSQYEKKRYQKNKEKIGIYSKKYYQENKKYVKEYYQTPLGVYSHSKNSAKQRDIEFNIKKIDFIKWYNTQEQKCYYCNRTLEDIRNDHQEVAKYKTRLSIDRKNNNIGYTSLDNIILACGRCNIIKGEYFTEQEMLKIGKILYQK